MRGADLLVRTLARAGVSRIFSLSGNQIMPIYDACHEANIEIVHTRHEAAAVFMAEAHGQLTGTLGVALVTAGPGAANALGPLFTARHSESPVLLLTGDSPLSQDGRGAFQELPQVQMTQPVTKLSFRAVSAEQLGHDMARAIRTALSGRPGPVHVALPVDVVDSKVSNPTLPREADFRPVPLVATPDDVAGVVSALETSNLPLILCGPAFTSSRAGHLLAELCDAVDAPVIAMESPRGLKDPSLGNFAQAVKEADLIVCLGKPVNFALAMGRATSTACRWIVVDPEAAELARAEMNLSTRLLTKISADTRSTIHSMISLGPIGTHRSVWRDHVTTLMAVRASPDDDLAPGKSITPTALCAAVQRRLDAVTPSVVISDGGEFGQWVQGGLKGTVRMINGPSGAIGGGICYALAAKKAKPDSTVVALMGDGSFGFHLAEFETAVREKTPFVVVIGNDERWNAEHQIQLRSYGSDRLIGCQLSGARYDVAVAGLGGHGEFVSDPAGLDAALERAFSAGKPACVNVRINGVPAPEVGGGDTENDVHAMDVGQH